MNDCIQHYCPFNFNLNKKTNFKKKVARFNLFITSVFVLSMEEAGDMTFVAKLVQADFGTRSNIKTEGEG